MVCNKSVCERNNISSGWAGRRCSRCWRAASSSSTSSARTWPGRRTLSTPPASHSGSQGPQVRDVISVMYRNVVLVKGITPIEEKNTDIYLNFLPPPLLFFDTFFKKIIYNLHSISILSNH